MGASCETSERTGVPKEMLAVAYKAIKEEILIALEEGNSGALQMCSGQFSGVRLLPSMHRLMKVTVPDLACRGRRERHLE